MLATDRDPSLKPSVLVTGASGFVGRNLCNHLGSLGVSTHAMFRKGSPAVFSMHPGVVRHYISPQEVAQELPRILNSNRITHVVHAITHFAVEHEPAEAAALIEGNVAIGAAILEACANNQQPQFVNLSSYWQGSRETRIDNFSLYSASKRAFLEILNFYESTHRLPTSNVYLHDTYGPADGRQKVLSLLLDAAATGQPIAMSSGRQRLNLLHIRDVCDGLATIMNTGELGDLELAATETVSVRELARIVERVSHRQISAQWGSLPDRASADLGGVPLGRAPSGWSPQESIETGVGELWSAYLDSLGRTKKNS